MFSQINVFGCDDFQFCFMRWLKFRNVHHCLNTEISRCWSNEGCVTIDQKIGFLNLNETIIWISLVFIRFAIFTSDRLIEIKFPWNQISWKKTHFVVIGIFSGTLISHRIKFAEIMTLPSSLLTNSLKLFLKIPWYCFIFCRKLMKIFTFLKHSVLMTEFYSSSILTF